MNIGKGKKNANENVCSEFEGLYGAIIFIDIKNKKVSLRGNLKSIFDRFTQVDNTMRRNNEGSGIGLSIANSFVTLHKGTIDVKSKENEGSEFIVKIPIKLIDEENILFYDREILDNNAKTELSDIYL